MNWQEYLHASRRPRLEGEQPSDDENPSEDLARAIGREEGRSMRKKKLRGKSGAGDAEVDDTEDVGWRRVSDVIGLMAKKTAPNATARPAMHKKVRLSFNFIHNLTVVGFFLFIFRVEGCS